MWIKTCTAWYKLLEPSTEYREEYVKSLRVRYLAKLVFTTIQSTPDISVDEFMKHITLAERPELLDASEPYTLHDLKDKDFVSPLSTMHILICSR
jgi:hypothetical protein